ncbi:deoxyribonuclease IV [Enemella evansiae]|uniref:Deoxyribonuclease IV n=1 Tax=Enemella evansiae TaxID=2016499 RepID=A0A255GNT4_9ACTN|nr:deoxyribonuclease IV [Enemella evansiae]OYO17475.1 deoxyribonuclease IV [Enemella evansiae]
MLMGAHVEQTDPVAEAVARGADVAQFFLGDPQGWKAPMVSYAGGADGLKQAAADAGVTLYVHAPYVLNVATFNNRIRIPSRKLLQQHVNLAAEVGAAGVIVHGGHLGAKDDPEKGFDNWRKAIDGLEMPVPVLIENTAGGSNAMARHLERIERLWAAVLSAEGGDQVGFCLDTCHAHAGGNELLGLVGRVQEITGRIDLVHINDSRDDFDSGADRHANLGSGNCDPEGLAEVCRQAGAPLMLETPGGVDEHRADLDWLRERV